MFYNWDKVSCIDAHKNDEIGRQNLLNLQNDLIDNKMQLHERELAHAWSIFSIKIANLARELDERKDFSNTQKPNKNNDFNIF